MPLGHNLVVTATGVTGHDYQARVVVSSTMVAESGVFHAVPGGYGIMLDPDATIARAGQLVTVTAVASSSPISPLRVMIIDDFTHQIVKSCTGVATCVWTGFTPYDASFPTIGLAGRRFYATVGDTVNSGLTPGPDVRAART